MTLRLFLGFITASLVQFVFVVLSESIGLSMLNPAFSSSQLILHFVVGQVFGWLFYLLWDRFDAARSFNPGVIGAVYGIMVWFLVLPYAAASSVISPTWSVSANLVVSSTAFALYGIFTAYTVSTTRNLLFRGTR